MFCLTILGAAYRSGGNISGHGNGRADGHGNDHGHGNGLANSNNNFRPPAERYNYPRVGDRVFIQMPKDSVFFGVLENTGWRPIPAWVTSPHSEPNMEERVFVQLPHAPGLVARLAHYHDYNNVSVQANRCFIQSDNDIFFLANLDSRNHPLGLVYIPRVYVRIPDPNNTVYTGLLRRGWGHLNFQ